MRRFLREWRVEITLFLVLAVGVFLVVERLDIRVTLQRWLISLLTSLAGVLTAAVDALLPKTLSDATGLILITVVVLVAGWRLRWRLTHSTTLAGRVCPKCGGRLHRIHRKSFDRTVNAFVPVRRYRCHNAQCRWSGLRVSTRESYQQPGEEDAIGESAS